MNAIFDDVVVVDGCAGVDDGKTGYPAAGVNYDAGHYHRAFTNGYVRSDDCTGMDRFGQMPSAIENQQSELPTEPRFADPAESLAFMQGDAKEENLNAVNNLDTGDKSARARL